MKSAATLIAAALLALSLGAQAAGAPAKNLADRHVAAGMKCANCHGADEKNPTEPKLETCTACHALGALVAKTKEAKPRNPHMSPHYQDKLDCINCHVMHDEQENFCNQCHKFDFRMP